MNDTAKEKMPDYLPFLHMNGTGTRDLHEGYSKADDVMDELMRAMSKDVIFHQRDYYPIDGLWEKARSKREEMVARLQEVREYIKEHMDVTWAPPKY
jgi:hypothetical protein